ncbi:hypothetical protein HBO32_01665 [Pseudomonas nitroreducens]|nr:hypothetical protein [Pseudomonas nitroreducens]OBY58018.1 hypothetical protein A9513_007315 [Pseudomonas sp. AU12215]
MVSQSRHAAQWVEDNLPPELKVLLRRAERVILVANNPAISAGDFDALALGPRDVVVSFNTAVKAELLSAETVNVFVHGYHGQEFHFFGLPCRPCITRLFEQSPDRCFTLLVGVVNPMSALPRVAIYEDRIPLPTLLDYPRMRPSGKPFAGPSTGFNAMVVFDWLLGRPGYTYELFALGFSNEAGTLWNGHAWDYERAWMHASRVRVIALESAGKRWWWPLRFKGKKAK